MNKTRRVFQLMMLVMLVASQDTAQKKTTKSSLDLKPCTVKDIQGEAKCGALEVFENRATRKGRTIKLNVLVLPATGRQRAPDPLFYFAGGPWPLCASIAISSSWTSVAPASRIR